MRLRTKAAVAATTMLGTGVAALLAGRIGSDAALRPSRAGTAPGFEPGALTVHEVGTDEIVLSRTLDTLLPGTYGLQGPGAHAVVGDPLADREVPPDTVVRRLLRTNTGALRTGDRVRLTPQVHVGDPADALGVACADAAVPGELGTLPSWFVPGSRDTWVIAVHGPGTTGEHPTALVPLFHGMQVPVLGISYRGDPDAPRPVDGLAHLGTTEWRDVDAAMRYALRYGARRLVLHGWSTGATAALNAAARSTSRAHVAGLILDSPVLDWRAAVRALAAGRVPGVLLPLAERAAQGRAALEPTGALAAAPGRLPVPVLLLHSRGDTVAPWDVSWRYAGARPELVTLYTAQDARHAALWNADQAGYEEAVRRFLVSTV